MRATVIRPGEGEKVGWPTAVTIKRLATDRRLAYNGEVRLQPGFPVRPASASASP